MAELEHKMRWVNCLAIATCRLKLSLQIGLRVGGHLAPADIHSSDPSELVHGFAIDDSTTDIVLVIISIVLLLLHAHRNAK